MYIREEIVLGVQSCAQTDDDLCNVAKPSKARLLKWRNAKIYIYILCTPRKTNIPPEKIDSLVHQGRSLEVFIYFGVNDQSHP